MTSTSRAIHESNWSALAPPPSTTVHDNAYASSIWQTELSLLDGIITEVRALRKNVAHSNPSKTAQQGEGDAPANQLSGTVAAVVNAASPIPAANLSTPPQPIVVAVLPAMDPETAEQLSYEIVDADGTAISHPQFELVGHQLQLRANIELPEADSGCAALHLLVASEAGLSTIEEFVIRLGGTIENAISEEKSPLSGPFRAPNMSEALSAIDQPI